MDKKVVCMPILALRGLVVFPNTLMHFDVARPKSTTAVKIAMEGSRRLFLVAQRDIRTEDPISEDLCNVGVVAKIHQILKMPDDTMRVFIKSENRAVATSVVVSRKYIYGDIIDCEEQKGRISNARTQALVRSVVSAFMVYAEEIPNFSEDILINIQTNDHLPELTDYISSNANLPLEHKQSLLECLSPVKRVEMLIKILRKETELLKVEREINQKVQLNMEQNQKDYFLREKIKVINEELDGDDDAILEAEEYEQKIETLVCSDEIKESLRKEVSKLLKMPSGSHEGMVIRNYLDLCVQLPYDKISVDSKDIKKAEKILNADHFGLKKVKERILEFLSAKMMNPELKGQIICLVGPPGTGKTSVAKSIARSIHKEYVRISLGGVHDESEIRGHRKTYIGAMPGRIVDALKKSGVSNPVMLLDEVDKLASDYRGDPSSALLEVLDSEQNHAFRDHYVENPVDLSRVFFVATANTASTIPSPLLDRMEVIEIVSYTSEEKFHIAKKHLLPKQMKRHGLTAKHFRLTDKALREIISSYVKEAGVRKLERIIATLCRKVTRRLNEGESKVAIKETDLEKLLGAAKYKNQQSSHISEVGVTNGLAFTSVGGELLKVEVSLLEGKGKIIITGSLGDVMKESATLAVSYVRSIAKSLLIDENFYKNKDIHIHFPEGAVPKDGPSAGVTIVTSLVSALINIPVKSIVAMTGEITLKGKVLPIGGLREKTMAAYNNGIKTVIIPKNNFADLQEVEEVVRKNIEFVLADNLETVLKTAIAYDVLGKQKNDQFMPSIQEQTAQNADVVM